MPFIEAKNIVLSSFTAPDKRIMVSVPDACGCVLAEPVYSKRTNPPLRLCGPDGIAVRSSETAGAGKDNGIEIEAPRVNTGLSLPEGFDAVIAIEDVAKIAENRYRIHAPVSQYENTIPRGSDIEEGDLVMDSGHLITPLDIGALLNCGFTEIPVKKWKVGLIPTGDEIISPYEAPLPGQIVDTNSYIFAAYLRQSGVEPVLYPIIPDDRDLIVQEVQKALSECDMVLVFGGSSAGSKDFTVDALRDSGELLIHGVAMGPGKPVSVARVNGKPAFGMPGPSISARAVFHELVCPLLVQWGVPVIRGTFVKGVLAKDLPVMGMPDRFMLARVVKRDGGISIVPMPRPSGYMPGVRADAILHFSRSSPVHSGDEVEVRMLRAINSL